MVLTYVISSLTFGWTPNSVLQGNLVIEQPGWNQVPQVANGAGECRPDDLQRGGNVICNLDLTTTLDDSVCVLDAILRSHTHSVTKYQ